MTQVMFGVPISANVARTPVRGRAGGVLGYDQFDPFGPPGAPLGEIGKIEFAVNNASRTATAGSDLFVGPIWYQDRGAPILWPVDGFDAFETEQNWLFVVLAVALTGRRKAVPLPSMTEKIPCSSSCVCRDAICSIGKLLRD